LIKYFKINYIVIVCNIFKVKLTNINQYLVQFEVVLGRVLGGILLVIGELTKNNPHKITIYCIILKYFVNILHY